MNTSAFLAKFQAKQLADRRATANTAPADIVGMSRVVSAAVEEFTINTHLCGVASRPSTTAPILPSVSLETLDGQLDATSLDALIQAAYIPADLRDTAKAVCVNLIARHAGNEPAAAWANQLEVQDHSTPTGKDVMQMSLEQLYSDSTIRSMWGDGSLEAFGLTINTVVPDLQKALTVSLMAFHAGVAPRILPVRPTASPAVRYVVNYTQVYDNDDTTTAETPMIELYVDPSLVANDLKQIVPLAANDSDNSELVSDGVIKPGVEANLLTLSIDANTPGYERVNRTDLVADGVKLLTLLVTVTKDATPDVVEDFEIVVPEEKARFTRSNDSEDASDRLCMFTHEKLLTAGAHMSNASDSVIFSTGDGFPASGEGAKLRLNFSGRINLKTGVIHAQCSVAVSAHSTDGTATSYDYTKLSATVKAYTVDARFSEENMRKSSLAIRSMKRTMEYEISYGRNFHVDLALGQTEDEETIANIGNVIRIGQDDVSLTAIKDGLTRIKTMYDAQIDDKTNLSWTIGHYFAGGLKVRPYVYTDTLALGNITTIRSSDRSGDIKQYVLSFLTGLTSELQKKSLIRQQLTAGTPMTYRLLTDEKILAAILGVEHIHNHLNKAAAQQSSDGTDYTLVLPNGVIIGVVTTTFTEYTDTMILTPVIPGNAESELNFGHLWDFGTMVGAFQHTDGRGFGRRVYANARQLPVITCPVGAIIEVTGVDAATYLPVHT